MSSEGKRSRNPNFSSFERQLLLKLANEKKNVLENKRTDSTTNGMKITAWAQITDKFNSSCGQEGQFRDMKCLRSKYECIKKELRKSFAEKAWKKTGGGPYQPLPTVTEEENELASSIRLSIEGLQSFMDSDSGIGTGVNPTDVSAESSAPVEININWQKSNAFMLQTAKDNALSLDAPSCSNISILHVQNELVEGTAEVGDVAQAEVLESNEIIQESIYHTPSPHTSDERSSRRRPVLAKKRNMTSASLKFETLAEKKQKLVEMKQEHLNLVIENEKEKHEQIMKNLMAEGQIKKLQAEEIKLRIEILKQKNEIL